MSIEYTKVENNRLSINNLEFPHEKRETIALQKKGCVYAFFAKCFGLSVKVTLRGQTYWVNKTSLKKWLSNRDVDFDKTHLEACIEKAAAPQNKLKKKAKRREEISAPAADLKPVKRFEEPANQLQDDPTATLSDDTTPIFLDDEEEWEVPIEIDFSSIIEKALKSKEKFRELRAPELNDGICLAHLFVNHNFISYLTDAQIKDLDISQLDSFMQAGEPTQDLFQFIFENAPESKHFVEQLLPSQVKIALQMYPEGKWKAHLTEEQKKL